MLKDKSITSSTAPRAGKAVGVGMFVDVAVFVGVGVEAGGLVEVSVGVGSGEATNNCVDSIVGEKAISDSEESE